MAKLFKLLLDDYSIPSFSSFSKPYFGTLEDVSALIADLSADEDFKDGFSETKEAFDKYMAGETNVTHNIAYQDVPFLTPTTVYYEYEQPIGKMEWHHVNTWGCIYEMKFDSADVRHFWLKDGDKFYRVMKARVKNICHKNTQNEWVDGTSMFWGFPCMLVVDGDILFNRLACVEKIFDSFSDMTNDYMSFMEMPDVEFQQFCNDIFGDG